MARTIGIIAIKGGVGKTTISASIAADLVNHYGKKVLLIDSNYSAPNLGLHMDVVEPGKTIHDVLAGKARMSSAVHKRYGVDVVPGSYNSTRKFSPFKLKDRIKNVKNEYDFVILDSSPSMNEEILSAMLASDNLFVVTTPDYPTLYCSLKAAKLAKNRGRPVSGMIINRIRNPKYEISLHEIEDSTEIPVVAKIPEDDSGVKSLFTRIPMSIFNRNSGFSKEVNRLNAALIGVSERRSFWRKIMPFDFRKERINREIMKESFYGRVFK
jgi:septum site-determining protein MinD